MALMPRTPSPDEVRIGPMVRSDTMRTMIAMTVNSTPKAAVTSRCVIDPAAGARLVFVIEFNELTKSRAVV